MKKSGMNLKKIFVASVVFTLFGSFVFAKPKTNLVKEEAGYYYGYGKGSTKEAAELAGKKDLVENALTATLKRLNPKASRVKVAELSAKERLAGEKYWQKNAKDETDVVFRMELKDWEKIEKDFSEKLRTNLSGKVSSLTGKKLAEKINTSVEILKELADNGEVELLTVDAKSSELISKKVESICKSAVDELQFTLSTKDGFVDSKTKFSVKATDSSGKAIAGLKIKTSWTLSSVLPTDSDVELPEVNGIVTTDNSGSAIIEYPSSEEFKNSGDATAKSVVLSVSTAFTESAQATKAMKAFDVSTTVDGNYVYSENVKNPIKTVDVAAGEFNAGKVSQDKKAGNRETSRKVKTGAYSIFATPVTNAEFAAFVHATRSESIPEYFENSSYNQSKQPVIGVNYDDAEAYATWLSEQTGSTYRLPTEEEWEKAARAGKDSIYPWGDDAPNKKKNANYKGNGKFKTTSPVDSFSDGNNEWGLVDMAGNVWEWTSSTHDSADSTKKTVKGGSYLDGPNELRISNYKELNSQNGYADVGFRLVKEIAE